MKTPTLLKITVAIVLALTAHAYAHSDVKIGPNGGRILDFSTDQTVHGEVVAKDGAFHIALLDKDMKPLALAQQSLTATTGDRTQPEKLTVETKDGKFIVPLQPGDDHWTIFQFRQTPEAKLVTARLRYIATPCVECGKPDWLCECAVKAEAEKK